MSDGSQYFAQAGMKGGAAPDQCRTGPQYFAQAGMKGGAAPEQCRTGHSTLPRLV